MLFFLKRGPDDPTTQPGQCRLMDSFAIFIQLCLAAVAFSTLLIKRHREKPRRPLRIWSLDVSKQLVGSILIHSLNVVAAYFFGNPPDEGQVSNPCVWYLLNILVDCTVGVAILWVFLLSFRYLTDQWLQWPGFRSGVYGDPPLSQQMKPWLKQLAVYTLSLMLMKMVVVLIFRLCPWLESVGYWMLGWTSSDYKLQVAFVMLIFPLVMNIIQFWIIDTIVKHSDKKPIRLRHHDDEEDTDTLLMERSDLDGSPGGGAAATAHHHDAAPVRQLRRKTSEDEAPLLAHAQDAPASAFTIDDDELDDLDGHDDDKYELRAKS
ncbi:vacuolar membrane protein-domain-containing protein [Gongronella butleri]|nr:vacuolar membrane protein-domain-containing protein [Gongronella butleri]